MTTRAEAINAAAHIFVAAVIRIETERAQAAAAASAVQHLPVAA